MPVRAPSKPTARSVDMVAAATVYAAELGLSGRHIRKGEAVFCTYSKRNEPLLTSSGDAGSEEEEPRGGSVQAEGDDERRQGGDVAVDGEQPEQAKWGGGSDPNGGTKAASDLAADVDGGWQMSRGAMGNGVERRGRAASDLATDGGGGAWCR